MIEQREAKNRKTEKRGKIGQRKEKEREKRGTSRRERGENICRGKIMKNERERREKKEDFHVVERE